MAPSGRRGPGRPPGSLNKITISKAEAREALRAVIQKHVEEMTLAQIQAAKGLTVAVMRRKDGTFRRIESAEEFDKAVEDGAKIDVHTLAPSTAAYTDLLNRAHDKPREQEFEVRLTGLDELHARLDRGRARHAKR